MSTNINRREILAAAMAAMPATEPLDETICFPWSHRDPAEHPSVTWMAALGITMNMIILRTYGGSWHIAAHACQPNVMLVIWERPYRTSKVRGEWCFDLFENVVKSDDIPLVRTEVFRRSAKMLNDVASHIYEYSLRPLSN